MIIYTTIEEIRGNMVKVSIITASYNYGNYIKETIESVISQTYTDWEMIIVDDGSKDNSVEVIKSYCEKDSRIKLFQHENGENKGLAETIQLGISKATSEWIVFLESDDTITPDYLKEKIKIIEQYPTVDFIFNDINMFGEENVINNMERYFKKQKKLLSEISFPANIFNYFEQLNVVPTFSAVMIKKELFNYLDFKVACQPNLDWYLWIQASKNNKFYYLDKKLTNWRMHRDSQINNINPLLIYKWEIQKEKLFGYEPNLINKILKISKEMFYIKQIKSIYSLISPQSLITTETLGLSCPSVSTFSTS